MPALPARRTAHRIASLTAAGSCVLLAGTPAWAAPTVPSSAAAPSSAPGGWQRYHARSFTAPAGTLCPFALHSQVLFDREYVRTTSVFADGSPRTQQFVGPLVVRVADVATGRSVRRDLSGRAVVRHTPDGASTYQLHGPVAVGFHPGDSLAPGYYVLRGDHTVRFAADGTRTVTVDRGTEEDLCATLR